MSSTTPLLSQYDLHELEIWARDNNIYTRLVKLTPELRGFVTTSSYGSHLIAIDKNITLEMQQETLLHEINHIINHFPKLPYIIGLDMQHTTIEDDPDKFLEIIAESGGDIKGYF